MKLSNEQKISAGKLQGAGHYSSRMCFQCCKPKGQMGGGKCKKTGQWICAGCKLPEEVAA